MFNVHSDDFPAMWREVSTREGFGSLLAMPLTVEGEVFGALLIAAPEADAFGDEERQVLYEVADDLAFGLQTLRLKRRREQAEQEILHLNRALRTRVAVSSALIHATDEQAMLKQICDVAVQECGYRLAWIGFIDGENGGEVRSVAWSGVDDGFMSLPRRWKDGGPLRRLQEGRPWIVHDVARDTTYPFPEEAQRRGFASMIGLPLREGERLLGTFHILSADRDAFDEQETSLLMAMAADLAFGLGALRARTAAAAAEETIRRMAWFDPATELPNRTRFRTLLADAIRSCSEARQPLALLRIGLDRFREINETLGDAAADRLIRDAADRMRAVVGEGAPLARTADCEFAVLLPRGGAEHAQQLGRAIQAALADPVPSDGVLLDARCSIGISLFPGQGSDADALLRRSSMAMERARGSSGLALFQGSLDRDSAQRLSLMADLRSAIEHDELQLYCQPKLRLASRDVCGAEALLRWRHPRLGLVNPGSFIKLAESAGLITPLTYWVLEAALRQSYIWREQGLSIPLSVNLSARDLRDPKLIERIGGAMATWGTEPGSMEFELTESALMDDPAGALETLTRLKQLDVSLAIDDFGTGYSSLSYLQRLPVDAIKIDQSFVSDMRTNKDSAAIVRSTIDLAHNLEMGVIAEGVEDQPTFECLAALGCDMAQGFCISEPIPAECFGEWRSTLH
jgi:diguanylate cyclase (GGDEF)-like protein